MSTVIQERLDQVVTEATSGADEQREALKALYASIQHRCQVSMLDYIEQVVGLGFEVTPIRDIDGEIIGAALIRESEVHLGVKRRPRGSQRKLVHEVLDPVMKRYGYATTVVKDDNPAGRLFCRRLGFHAAHRMGGATIYICMRATHA